jgi:hypothetical protein
VTYVGGTAETARKRGNSGAIRALPKAGQDSKEGEKEWREIYVRYIYENFHLKKDT